MGLETRVDKLERFALPLFRAVCAQIGERAAAQLWRQAGGRCPPLDKMMAALPADFRAEVLAELERRLGENEVRT